MNNLLIKDGFYITHEALRDLTLYEGIFQHDHVVYTYDTTCRYFIAYEMWFDDIKDSVSEYIKLYKQNPRTNKIGLSKVLEHKEDNSFYINIPYKTIMDAYKDHQLQHISSIYGNYYDGYQLYYSESDFLDGRRVVFVEKIDGTTDLR